MDFFERQDRARGITGRLVALFGLAILLITLGVNVVIWLTSAQLLGMYAHLGINGASFAQWLSSQPGIITTLVTLAIIAAGSLVRASQLRQGGVSLARMIGARRLSPETTDEREIRLRNLTEEMSIASGIPAPRIYVLDQESGINAMVAGYHPGEATLIVTQGALEHLSRDELQGVIGHEFSHILNADMRINLRLMSLLAGILLIGEIGQYLMRSSRRSRSKEASAAISIGLFLAGIGYAGLFCGRLIKSAISRQREFLADAAAVQFTRNPEGIGGALMRIRQHTGQSQLTRTRMAEEMNHMFFGESVSFALSGWLASHPPLDERVNSIDPTLLKRWQPDHDTPPPAAPSTHTPPTENVLGFAAAASGHAAVSQLAGRVPEASHRAAVSFLDELPLDIQHAMRRPAGAAALAMAILSWVPSGFSAPPADTRKISLTAYNPATVRSLRDALGAHGDAWRFPLLELMLPALKSLSTDERAALIDGLHQQARDDGRISLREFSVLAFLRHHLSDDAERAHPIKHRSYDSIRGALTTVLWMLIGASGAPTAEREGVFQAAMRPFTGQQAESPPTKISASDLEQALRELSALTPLLKPGVIDACADCVLRDGKVTVGEYDLVRLLALALDCPLPMLPKTSTV